MRPIIITDQQGTYVLDGHADMLNSPVTVDRIVTQFSLFKPFAANDMTIGSSRQNVHWVRFTVRNESDEHVYSRVTYGGFSRVDLYEWDGRKAVLVGKGGMDVTVGELYMPQTTAIIPLLLERHQQKTYLVRTERVWTKQSPLILYTESSLIGDSQLFNITAGLFLGYVFAITVYILIAWFLSREISYVFLFSHFMMQLLQNLVGSGLIPGYVDLPVTDSNVFVLILTIGGLTSNMFLRRFLEIDRYGNRFIHAGYRLNWYGYAIMGGLSLVFPDQILDCIAPYSFISLCLVIYSDIYILRKGFKPAKYLLLSHSIPLLAIPFVLVQVLGYSNFDGHYVASSLLMLSLTGHAFTVGYKVRLFKDEAEALILEQNQKLEGIVAERTRELSLERDRADVQSERLKLALRELNHRVRNNLAVVSSLLKLQSNTIDPDKTKQVFAESRQRVDAMALIHQQLYQSEELTTIDVPVFVTNLVQVLSDAYGYTPETLQVNLRLDPVILPVEKAVPLSLLLNEVLTNAFKYGLTRAAEPVLHITLQTGEEDIRLDITDNGPGIDLAVWQAKTGSFGRRLIDGLTRQLKGSFTIDNQAGTTFRFTLPIHQDLLVLE